MLNLPVAGAMAFTPYSWAPLAASAVVTGVYGWLAFRRVYAESALATAVKVLALAAAGVAWSWIAMFLAFRYAIA